MTVTLAFVLLFFAPQNDSTEKVKTYQLAYRFEKGDEYLETTTRHFLMELIEGKSLSVTEVTATEALRRVVLETKKRRPVIERIIVEKFSKDVKKSPLQKEIRKTEDKAVGRKYVWRRVGDKRWGLFTEQADVTAQNGPVVARLKNWRDNRLPKKSVIVGETWSVSASEYLTTLGQNVPKGTTGNMEFTLKAMDKNGIATIAIAGVWSYLEPGTRVVVTQAGTWTFDVKNGRDLKMESSAKIDMSGAQDGKARLKMTRVVKWKKRK